MSSLRVGGGKSGGRKPTLDSSRDFVVKSAFSFRLWRDQLLDYANGLHIKL